MEETCSTAGARSIENPFRITELVESFEWIYNGWFCEP